MNEWMNECLLARMQDFMLQWVKSLNVHGNSARTEVHHHTYIKAIINLSALEHFVTSFFENSVCVCVCVCV
jgi:hypothetical protein